METAPGHAPPPRPLANGRAAAAAANQRPGARGEPMAGKEGSALTNEEPAEREAAAAANEEAPPAAILGSRAANEEPGAHRRPMAAILEPTAANEMTSPAAILGSAPANEQTPPAAILDPTAANQETPLAAILDSAPANEEPGAHRQPMAAILGSAAANQETSSVDILDPTAANEELPPAAIFNPTPANEEPPPAAILDPTPANEEPPLAAILDPMVANEELLAAAILDPTAANEEPPPAAILDPTAANEEPPPAAILDPTAANEEPPPAAILDPTPANEEPPLAAILDPMVANEELLAAAILDPTAANEEPPPAAILDPTAANGEPLAAAIFNPTPANEEPPPAAILDPTPANEEPPPAAMLDPTAANEEPLAAAMLDPTAANEEPLAAAILDPTAANGEPLAAAILDPTAANGEPPSPSPSGDALSVASSLGFAFADGDGSSGGSDSEAAAPASRRPDRHGFLGGNQFSRGPARPVPVSVSRQRELKWLQMLQHWDTWLGQRYHKVKLRCRKGVPPSLRARAWQFLSRSQSQLDAHPGLFQELQRRPGDPRWVDAIERDLHRQFPLHEMFVAQGGAGQQDLFRVLKAYSVYRPLEGYCQAQAPVAAVLLMHMPAEQAFWCLVQICDKYLPGYYSAGLEALQLDGRVFEALARRVLPAAQRHLRQHRVEPPLYLTEWFMCLFARSLPWAAVLRVWDMFFCEGAKILFRVGLALLRRALGTPQKLRSCPGFYETMEALKSVPWAGDSEEQLVHEVASVPVSGAALARARRRLTRRLRRPTPPPLQGALALLRERPGEGSPGGEGTALKDTPWFSRDAWVPPSPAPFPIFGSKSARKGSGGSASSLGVPGGPAFGDRESARGPFKRFRAPPRAPADDATSGRRHFRPPPLPPARVSAPPVSAPAAGAGGGLICICK
ncbi:TBC1 domain family member 10A-like [Caloenas nicobarica]|uniref:TBC1 domain family member 10A-like n=1 Tax=Caloenas nicobarica TaxID=187106 RepID=UPI0032B7E7EF